MADNTTNPGETPAQPKSEAPLTWDTWQTAWTEEQKGLYKAQTENLKKALDTERENQKALAKLVKELQGKAEAGSEMQTKLSQMQEQLQSASRRADFALDAPAKGVTNVKAALTLAIADGLIDKDGKVDWDGLKEAYPEMFAKQQTPPPDTNSQERGKGGGLTHEQLIAKKRASGIYSQF
jgi:hypothetical protein